MDLRFLLLLCLSVTMVMADGDTESQSESESESSEEEGTKYEVDDDEHIGENQKRDEEEAEKGGKSYRSAYTDRHDAAIRQMQKYAWPDCKVIYRLHPPVTKYRMKSRIVAAMKLLEKILSKNGKKCITFEKKKSRSQRNFVKIIEGDGCYADVGFQGGKQELSLGPGCYTKGTMWHQLLHCLGLYHEHSRLDRDNYVTIHSAYIKSGMEHNFKKRLTNRVDALKNGYDIKSLMHGSPFAFSVVSGKQTIENKKKPRDTSFGQRLQLSPGDIVAIRKLCDCDEDRPQPRPTPSPRRTNKKRVYRPWYSHRLHEPFAWKPI